MLLMIRIITLKYAGKLFICNYSIIYFGPHILQKKTLFCNTTFAVMYVNMLFLVCHVHDLRE